MQAFGRTSTYLVESIKERKKSLQENNNQAEVERLNHEINKLCLEIKANEKRYKESMPKKHHVTLNADISN